MCSLRPGTRTFRSVPHAGSKGWIKATRVKNLTRIVLERPIRLTRSMIEAAQGKAFAEATVASKSFESRRLRLVQAKKRSTTQRLG